MTATRQDTGQRCSIKASCLRGNVDCNSWYAGKAHGMLSVVGLPDDVIEGICKKAVGQGSAGGVCQIANFLFPQVCLE